MSEWEGTYIFVRLMSNLWKIINVKNSTFGYKTRDTLRTPIKSENDEKIQILKQYLCLFKQWQASNFPGLSAPTFKLKKTLNYQRFNCNCSALFIRPNRTYSFKSFI